MKIWELIQAMGLSFLQGGLLSTSLILATSPPVSASPVEVEPSTQPPRLDTTPPPSGHSNPPVWAQQTSPPGSQPAPQTQPNSPGAGLDLSPEVIQGSPVLQRWLHQVPNVAAEIRNDPSFRTRLRLGYSQFPSTGQAAGVNVGVEDVFINRTGLTVSGEYQTAFNGRREAYGADLHYYVLPLGGYINFAPVVGYRHLETNRYSRDGLNLGARLLLVLSRGGAADIALTQSWVAPGSDDVGITTLSAGYALTRHLRLSTDIQKQNARQHKDSRVGIVLEWMP